MEYEYFGLILKDRKYYLISGEPFKQPKRNLKIIDEKTGLLLKQLEDDQFFIDEHKNLISISGSSIKYLDSNGVLKYEIKLDENFKEACSWLLNEKNELCCFDSRKNLLIIKKKRLF